MRLLVPLTLLAACGGSSPPPASASGDQPASREPAPTPSGAEAGARGGDEVPSREDDRDPSWTDTSVCAQRADQFGPIKLTAAQATGRYGHGATRFDQVMTTKARAVEVCGPSGEIDWLFATSCADGSHPFADRSSAHAARRGSMGGGSRCGSIIDLYAVPCPEQIYEVYMDMYMCGPDESM